MRQTLYALLPGTALAIHVLGPGVAINVAVAVLLALACEALAVRLRGRDVRRSLANGSIVLAAWLLALCVPPSLPLAVLAFGIAMTVFVGKHLYGGLGQNPFNPAMVGYVAMLVSFPASMSRWLDVSTPVSATDHGATEVPSSAVLPVSDSLLDWWTAKWSGDPTPLVSGMRTGTPDALSGATPLDRLRTAEHWHDAGGLASVDVASPDLLLLGAPGFVVALALLAGGLYLLLRGVIAWRIPVAVLGTLGAWHGLHALLESTPEPSPWVAVLSGGAVLGAFFVATDPVSGASGPRGRLLYGFGIGSIAFAIREYGAYPEGIAFGVLLMNAAVPLIDDRLVPEARR